MPKLSKSDWEKRRESVLAKMRAEAKPFPDTSEKARRDRRQKAESDPFWFFKTYLPHYFMVDSPLFHHDLIELLETKGNVVGIAAPRGFAKSTVCTFGNVIWKAAFKKRHFICICSATHDAAADFTSFIKLDIENNERLKCDYPEIRQNQAEDDFVWNDVRIRGFGRRESMRGVRHRQYRPDEFVCDDLEDDEMVKNPRRVNDVYNWLMTVVIPAMDPDKWCLFVIGTLLSKKSVLARILKENEDKGFITRIYRAFLENGESLWPERHSKESLLQKKKAMGSLAFNKEFMNDPKDEEGMFREEWIRYYHPSEIADKPLRKYGAVDPSVGSGQSSDFKALGTIGVDDNGIIYVLDAFIRKTTLDTLIGTTYDRYRQFRHLQIAVETVAFQEVLLKLYDMASKENENIALPLKGIKQHIAKESRVSKLSPLVERGKIRFLKGHSDQDIGVEQVLSFPSSTVNDDFPDMLEMAISLSEDGNFDVDFQASKHRRYYSGALDGYDG